MSSPIAAVACAPAHSPSPLDRTTCFGPAAAVASIPPAAPTASTSPAPALPDYQSALNEFGRMVGEAHQGKHFGVNDKARLDRMVDAYLARTDVSPEQKEAMRKIAAEFTASGGGGANVGKGGFRMESPDWADFLTRVGGLIKQVPGGEKIGQAMQDFGTNFRRAYNDDDGQFGKDDMRSLRGQSGAGATGELGRLHDLAASTFRGEKFSAPDFGRFLNRLTLPASVPARVDSPHPIAVAPVTTPAPSTASAAAVGSQPVSANAFGAGSVAFNIINNGGNLSFGRMPAPPHTFAGEVNALTG